MGKYRKVAFVEDFYSTIKEVHEKELLHAGYRKTYEKVANLNLFRTPTDLIHLLPTQVMTIYYGILRSVVLKFTSMCTTCQLRQPQAVKAPLKPIIAHGFLSRLQVRTCSTFQMGNTNGFFTVSTTGPNSTMPTPLRASMQYV